MSFDCHELREVASDIWWIEGRSAAQHGQDRTLMTKNYPAKDVNIVEVENVWLTYCKEEVSFI